MMSSCQQECTVFGVMSVMLEMSLYKYAKIFRNFFDALSMRINPPEATHTCCMVLPILLSLLCVFYDHHSSTYSR